MKAKIQIPRGWHKVRTGANYTDYDLYLDTDGGCLEWRDVPSHWSGNYITDGMLVIRRDKK